ncbi:MAG: histone deacetylase [Solirubrobacterales bacterium]|nr:histone deacetylase [Solirubrobacterales bacterium]
MAAPVLLRHASSAEHDTGRGHPESARRMVAVERALSERDWLGWDVRESPTVDRAVLEAVHSRRHVERIEAICERGGGAIDVDTILGERSCEAALRAAGGAVAMVDALLGEGAGTAGSLHRPPGHHALAERAMGFCLFNNVAVAARRALDAHGAGRVLILDFDVHHGNGTNDIFRSSDEVLFCSVHESPQYPGTGPASDVGSGAGEGCTVNLPVGHGAGDEAWTSLVEHVVHPLGRAYAPGLVLLSAGYDAHADDPLGGCAVTDAGFAAMAASMRALADDLGVPLGIVLEGGYDVDALARSLLRTLEVAAAPAPPAPPEVPVHPLAAQAVRRLAAGRWQL